MWTLRFTGVPVLTGSCSQMNSVHTAVSLVPKSPQLFIFSPQTSVLNPLVIYF